MSATLARLTICEFQARNAAPRALLESVMDHLAYPARPAQEIDLVDVGNDHSAKLGVHSMTDIVSKICYPTMDIGEVESLDGTL